MMIEQAVVALKNYEYLLREHGCENVRLIWHTDSLLFGEDGYAGFDSFAEPGFTRRPSASATDASVDLRADNRGGPTRPLLVPPARCRNTGCTFPSRRSAQRS
jgi:hypothetical protein